MNIRTISHRLIDCLSSRSALEAISKTLHFNFLEKKSKIESSAILEELVGKNSILVAQINNLSDSKAVFMVGLPDELNLLIVDLETKSVEKFAINIDNQVIDVRHSGEYLFIFSTAEISVFLKEKLLFSISLPEKIDEILATHQSENSYQFVLVSNNEKLQFVTINKNDHSFGIESIQAPGAVHKVRIFEEKLFVLTYLNQLHILKKDGQSELNFQEIRGSLINDFCIDPKTKDMIILTQNQLLSVFTPTEKLKISRKIEGIFSEISCANSHLILSDKFDDSEKLLLKIDLSEIPKISEILTTNDEIISIGERNKAIFYNKLSNRISNISWSNKSVCVSKPFLKFLESSQLRSITNPNIQDFFVWRENDCDKIFNVFLQFKSKECVIFRSNMAGLCRVEPTLGTSLFCPKDLDINILGYFRYKENDLIIYQFKDEKSYHVHFLNPATKKNIELFECVVKPQKAVFMSKNGLLFIVVDSKIQVVAEREGLFKGVKVIDFQGPLSSIDCQDDFLVATSLSGGIHLYKFVVKDQDIKILYFTGDKKNRRVTFGAFYGEKSVYYVLENGKTLFLSTTPDQVFKWSKTGTVFEQFTTMFGFDEVVQPLVKITQDGFGTFFKKTNQTQIDLLKEDRNILNYAEAAHTGLLFDSTGSVDLITKTKPEFIQQIVDNIKNKYQANLTKLDVASALLQVSGAISYFIGQDCLDLSLFTVESMEAPQNDKLLKVMVDKNPALADILKEVKELIA